VGRLVRLGHRFPFSSRTGGGGVNSGLYISWDQNRGKRMVIIDEAKCTGCALCADIRHVYCMAVTDGIVAIDYELCSTCTQCIAVCPQRALSWDNVPPEAFDEALLPAPEQLDELFRERRTIRFFREERMGRRVLEEIVNYGIYAPTNNYDLKAIVVDDREMLLALDRILLVKTAKLYGVLYRPRLIFNFLRKLNPGLDIKDKVKMEKAIEGGYAFRGPVAVVFVVGDKRVGLSRESAHYALCNMMYYAQVRGMGSRLLGAARILFNRSREARRLIGLKKREHIFGALGLGYPAVRFVNKPAGKKLPVRWNAGER